MITKITFHDYTARVELNFSKEFRELGHCINMLAMGLEKRDREIERKYIEIITILIKTLEEVDVYTKGHSERVSHYSVGLAEAVGFPDIETVRLSGLLHDVGKITISADILNKPGKLTEEEFSEIKKHPTTAFNILEVSDVFLNSKDIVKYHHEKMDGTGYPEQLKGDAIPLGARIVAIADVFDSLTSQRSYRDPMPVDEAIEIIRNTSGQHFDPDLVEAFIPIAHEMYRSWSAFSAPPQLEELLTTSESN